MTPATRARRLEPPTGPVDVVIDTDVTNEIDDQFAIVWALLRPDRIRLRALHACPYALGPHLLTDPGFLTAVQRAELGPLGEVARAIPVVDAAEGVARAAEECRRIVTLAGRDVPVRDGCARTLPDERTPVPSDAVDDLVALAHEDREGPLYVLGIGGATNLASALLSDPTIAERIVVVWTSAYPTTWPHPNVSFNLAQDLAASRVLLDSGVPLVYLPGYQVGEQLRVSLPDLEHHVRGRGPLGDYLYGLAADSHWYARPGTTKVIWDLIDVAWVLDHRWVPSELMPTPVLEPDLSWGSRPGRPLLREAHGVDRDGVFLDLYASLDAAAGRSPAG